MESETTAAPSKRWLKGAILCGVLPLLAGGIALFVFLQSAANSSDMEAWSRIGAFILMGGVTLFSLGLVTLGVYLLKGRRDGVSKRDLAQNAILTFILLMSNFPAALACVFIAGDSFSRVQLLLVNKSEASVEDLHITWPGGEHTIDKLEPQGGAEVFFHVSSDGTVDFTARQADGSCEGNLVGYVTPNMGVQTEVVFLGGCEFKATER